MAVHPTPDRKAGSSSLSVLIIFIPALVLLSLLLLSQVPIQLHIQHMPALLLALFLAHEGTYGFEKVGGRGKGGEGSPRV